MNLNKIDGPTFISYRSQIDQTSHFLKIDDVLKTNNPKKIKKIYKDIYQSITAYEPQYVDRLIKIEKKLYERFTHLKTTEKIEKLAKKDQSIWRVIRLLLTWNIQPSFFSSEKKQIKKMDEAHLKFLDMLKQMKQRTLKKEVHCKPKLIKELEERQLEDINVEISRLKSIPRVKRSLKNILNSRPELSESHLIAIGRSLELCEQLKETHYIINHGQNLELMIVNIVTRNLKQEFESERYESFENLRHDIALCHIQEDVQTVAWYQSQIKVGLRNDHVLRRELICGDCVLESTLSDESAIDFFAGKTNIAKRDNPSLINHLLLAVIQYYVPNQEVARKLCKKLVKVLRFYARGGNLYSICVPKKSFDESCYFSRPLGIPLPNQNYLKVNLEHMQSGQNPCGYPQIRILSHKIRPQDGYHVVLNSTLKNEELLKIENEVFLCVQAALTGYRV